MPDFLKLTFDKIEHDFHFLLSAFREVLADCCEERLAAALPWFSDDGGSKRKSPDPILEIHALSIAFQLLNLVEENAAIQNRRMRESQGIFDEQGLWNQSLRSLREGGFSDRQIANAFRHIHVEPVLTAHPTEAKRPTILQIHRTLYLHLVELENQMWTPQERKEIVRQIKATLERLWRTGEILSEKPEVESELDNAIHYLRDVFPVVIPKLDNRLRQAWEEIGFDPELVDAPDELPRLSFGNWIGGDRDGHPLVTAEVTRETLGKLTESALKVMEKYLGVLLERLSLSHGLQRPPDYLMKEITRICRIEGLDVRSQLGKSDAEPWRLYIRLILARLDATRRREADGYHTAAELAEELALLRRSLMDVGAGRIARIEVAPVERILSVFGLHLAALDIRQNSAFHDRAVSQLLEAAGFPDADFAHWPEEKRTEFLLRELESPRPLAPRRAKLGEEARAVLECHEVLVQHHDYFGSEGLGSLIVSMTRGLSDLLAVYLLAREVGLARRGEDGMICLVPVVPLFETVEDLRHAPDILAAFLDHPITRRSHKLWNARDTVQQVMVGYSDSNKDGGFLASLWHLNRAQKALAEAARSRGVNLQFFHGRGGSPSRGSGPTHRFLEALPPGALDGYFRVTEQGESIAQKYANTLTATHNLEMLLAGVTTHTLRNRRAEGEDPEVVAALELLAEYCREAYESLVRSEGFLDYWSRATPIDAVELTTIGSRPARRTGRRTLADLRAIPWVFSWNQSRHYLPGWYGLGSGIERLASVNPKAHAVLRERGTRQSFLRNALYNAETSLASADLDIMRQYASLVPEKKVRDTYYRRIVEEYERTGRMIDSLFEVPREQRRPRMLRTIHLRDSGLRRLHQHQVNLLREWREHTAAGRRKPATELLPPLLLTINAIASGLRTTG